MPFPERLAYQYNEISVIAESATSYAVRTHFFPVLSCH